MRLSRLPATLAAGVLLVGLAACASTVDGTGTLAADVPTGTAAVPTPTSGSSDSPTPEPTTDSPSETATPSATPTTDPKVTKERLLCVLEQGAISSINSQFNKSKDRDAQIRILRTGASTIRGHIVRSGLPETDGIRRTGTGVLAQLNRLVSDAVGGNTPSTQPYNVATQKFQKACSTVS